MNRKLKIVCIGNSITNGFPYPRSRSFPSIIREASGFDVINKGNNGESTADVLARFRHDVLDHHPDVVTIMSGTNDFIYNTDTPKGAIEKIKIMCQWAIDSGIRVILMTSLLTDAPRARREWIDTEDIDYEEVNRKILEYDSLMQEYGESANITLLDTRKAYMEFADRIGMDAAFHDGLHPTIGGYDFLAKLILEVLQKQ